MNNNDKSNFPAILALGLAPFVISLAAIFIASAVSQKDPLQGKLPTAANPCTAEPSPAKKADCPQAKP